MRFRIHLMLAVLATACCSQAAVGVRLILGLTDTNPAPWDGSVAAPGARVSKLEPWRFDVEFAADGTKTADEIRGNSWKLSTHRVRGFGGGAQPQRVVANGVIVWLDGENETTELNVKTAQGSFRVRLGDIPYGKNRKFLDDRVMADRVPASCQDHQARPMNRTTPPWPRDTSGNLWLAYIEFRHNPDHDRIRHVYQQRPHELRRHAGARRAATRF